MSVAKDYFERFKKETGITKLYDDDGTLNMFMTWIYNLPQEERDAILNEWRSTGAGLFVKKYEDQAGLLDVMNGNRDAVDYAGNSAAIAGAGSAEAEKFVDNMIARQNTGENQDWEEYMRNTALTSSAQQLQSLGLSSSGVLQTGGLGHSGVATAQNVKSNVTMQKYQERMSMAKSILGMTSQMARAGIMGGALAQSKQAASTLTAAASHSALQALRNFDKRPVVAAKDPSQGERYSDADLAALGW